MRDVSPNFKIEKMTYDEYLRFSNLNIHTLSKEIFEKYQDKEKGYSHYFKIRVNFDIVYFSISNSTLCFYNKDIYEYDFRTIEKIFKCITSLNLNQNICFYTPFKTVNKGTTEDYIDDRINKTKFIEKYDKYFKKQEYKYVWKIETSAKEEVCLEGVTIHRKGNALSCVNEQQSRIIFDIVDDELVMREIAYDRIIEDYKQEESQKYFLFIEEIVSMLLKEYKTIYTYTNIDFDYTKYFQKIEYSKIETIFQYWI